MHTKLHMHGIYHGGMNWVSTYNFLYKCFSLWKTLQDRNMLYEDIQHVIAGLLRYGIGGPFVCMCMSKYFHIIYLCMVCILLDI